MNTPTNNTRASASETPICLDVSCSSSSTDWFAATIRARIPIASDWPSTMTPRSSGLRRIGCRSAIERMSCDSRWTLAARTTHRDRPVVGAAHHDALDDRLSAVQVGAGAGEAAGSSATSR